MKRKSIIRKSAFTLIELVVSMAITSILMVTSFNIALQFVKQGEKAEARSELNRNVDYAVELMKRTIIQANAASISGVSATPSTYFVVQSTSKIVCFRWNSTSKIIEQVDNDATCLATGANIVGTSTKIPNLTFTFADGFLEINLNACDNKEIVYNCTNAAKQYKVVTGALVRN